LASFGLQCLKKALKTKGLILKSNSVPSIVLKEDNESKALIKEDFKAKLDPFVHLLLDSFKTYHTPITVTTLHILAEIIHLGLPSFKELMKKFLGRIFKLFGQTNSADSDFLNSLFKCTSELIKTYCVF
jgi:hypothetical protein